MQITIRYFTTLREITGKKEEQLTFPENQKITIILTLKTLTNKYGKPFTDYVFDTDGKIKNILQILINGTNISGPKQQEVTLQNGNVLAILPPVSGG
ncbi:MAG: MoaD family protein [Nitrososphaerota archaeon]|uniref:MoaD/ThiS family protein n=1 Tax=Candidatus Bathycorpusculum sp. TaxID=2994959 RepID=UPI00281CD7CC|nr:MoaD family protein [Candidatus Termiticorpusculum sp.]MCL2256948.1 MoaD family protein [Candidatus Termiticorpusculum sp.]MCL2292928.1 MoaD family protein [Candidatus Termiticorpusculum sp.]MDR0460771.1 MoaD family protein [Nitrososphaerota archaeon]